MMKLLRGREPERRIELLIMLTDMSSENVKEALKLHLSKGLTQELAAYMQSVPQGNVSRAVDTLNDVATIVEEIKQIDWSHLKVRK